MQTISSISSETNGFKVFALLKCKNACNSFSFVHIVHTAQCTHTAFISFQESKSIQFICQEVVHRHADAADDDDEGRRRRSNVSTWAKCGMKWNGFRKGNEKIYTLFAPNVQTHSHTTAYKLKLKSLPYVSRPLCELRIVRCTPLKLQSWIKLRIPMSNWTQPVPLLVCDAPVRSMVGAAHTRHTNSKHPVAATTATTTTTHQHIQTHTIENFLNSEMFST